MNGSQKRTSVSPKLVSWDRLSMMPPGDRNRGLLSLLSVDAFSLTIALVER
jgi:hypothetical protein